MLRVKEEREKRRKCDPIKSTSVSDFFRPSFPWSTGKMCLFKKIQNCPSQTFDKITQTTTIYNSYPFIVFSKLNQLILQTTPKKVVKLTIFISSRYNLLKMAFKKTCTLLVFVVILIAFMSPLVVEGRVLSEDFAGANHLATYSTVYEKAQITMSSWLQRLASGPSPRGPGH